MTSRPRPALFAPTLFVVAACSWPAPAFATIVVTTRADSGQGSLREAIQRANAALGPESITFAISSGAPPYVISPTSPLPPVTNRVSIIGTKNDVVLDGTHAGYLVCGIDLQGTRSAVESLVISGWSGCGIRLGGGGGHRIDRNRIGTDPDGRQAVRNTVGIEVLSSNNNIGGKGRNVVSGNGWANIWIIGGSQNRVEGNYIGPSVQGQHIGDGTVGLYMQDGTGNTIAGNLITAGNVGIELEHASSNVIMANRISTEAAAPAYWGSGMVFFSSSNDNVVGSPVAGTENIIDMRHVYGAGVYVDSTARGNSIRGNRIYDLLTACFGECLAIDLDPLGATPNDVYDIDSGANGLQNAPRVIDAYFTGFTTEVSGELEAQPFSWYTVDVYTSSIDTGSGSCETRFYLGSISFMTDLIGRGVFSLSSQTPVAPGQFVGATATAFTLTGSPETSEVSPCRIVRTFP